ncbi:MAG: Csu type fimbrial protein [Stenotrophomonas sp.]|uniref:Csu type fimbrial protein n=1 Tax=Stenotrophomonas sp. TaxID=69392 RepID=UPI003D6D7556
MNVRTTSLLAGLLAVALLPGAAHAKTDVTTTFQVKVKITESCNVTTVTATDVDFGEVARTTDPVAIDADGALNVNCSKGTPYQIGMNAGANSTSATASANNRRMASGSRHVSYGLYVDAARSEFWDTAGSTNTVSGVGNGVNQPIPVYGRIQDAPNVPAGVYTDTVTATVTY